MSLTIKQAFEALSDACANGMKNPFFVMRRLKESFADVASKVDGGGSEVTVTPIVTGGTKIATITVDGTNKDIYAPDIVYSTTEQKIGKWIDGSDLYRKVIQYTPESSITTGNHAIADVTGLKIVKYDAVAYNTTNGNNFHIPLPVGNVSTAIGTNGTNLILSLSNETWGTDSLFVVIIEYIKTT